MKLDSSSLAISLLLLSERASAWSHTSEARFRQALRNEYTLVAFVDPTQPSASALEAQWTSIQETERDNNVVSIDCSTNAPLCDSYGVLTYPAIRLFHPSGRMTRYRGPKKASAITSFLRRSLRPTISRLDDKNITSFLSIDDVVVVAHIAPDDTATMGRFESLATWYRDRYSFAVQPLKGEGRPWLACFNVPDDEGSELVELEGRVDAMERFVEKCATPLVVELTRRNEMQLLNMGKSLVHYFVTTDELRTAWIKEARKLAKTYKEYLLFTIIDANEYPEMMTTLGLKPGARRALVVHSPHNGDRFPYPSGEAVTAQKVEKWMMDIIQGKIKPWDGKEESRGHDEL